ncbi:MAG: deoxyguanosinetriphosphate triphosphohydrolase, partial [Firmicutes bacterium]|nr:deoxyguanosinetriphosphate triphosphohydrolase [Bacillota bacterium]
RIAYINHDIDDALRAGVLADAELPVHLTNILGKSHGTRINNMIFDVVRNSEGKPEVSMGAEFDRATEELRDFMFKHVYTDSAAKSEEGKAVKMLEVLYDYFIAEPDRLPPEYLAYPAEPARRVCDYIAMMSDRYATSLFERLFIPQGWAKL